MWKPTFLILLIFSLIALIGFSHSQGVTNVDEDINESTEPQPETVEEFEKIILTPIPGDTLIKYDYSAKIEEEEKVKKPTGALFRSLVFPGWGQFYNGSWIKGGIILCIETSTFLIGLNRYRIARRYYNLSKDAEGDERQNLYNRYEELIRETEFYGWVFAIEVVFSMLDAYVDAHMMDFDVSDIGVEGEEKGGEIEDMKLGLFLQFDF